MEQLLIKILTDCNAWTSNGEFKLYEQFGTYYISRRFDGSKQWINIAQFEEIEMAVSKYIELCTEDES